MANVSFLDTSILVNLLDIPHMNQDRERVIKEFKQLQTQSETLILPLAAIVETGNHIAHIDNGDIRRDRARRMAVYLEKTAKGEAPWVYYGQEMGADDLLAIAAGFPEAAMKSRMGIGDLSIICAYTKYKNTVPGIGRIRIWSIDQHLSVYEESIAVKGRRK